MREFEARVRMLEVAFAYLQIWDGKLWEGYSWKCPVQGGKKREERDCSLRFQKCKVKHSEGTRVATGVTSL